MDIFHVITIEISAYTFLIPLPFDKRLLSRSIIQGDHASHTTGDRTSSEGVPHTSPLPHTRHTLQAPNTHTMYTKHISHTPQTHIPTYHDATTTKHNCTHTLHTYTRHKHHTVVSPKHRFKRIPSCFE